jgi:hypothetical protein
MIDELCVTNMFFNDDTVKRMKQIVPEFVSNNSEYSRLDDPKKTGETPPQAPKAPQKEADKIVS